MRLHITLLLLVLPVVVIAEPTVETIEVPAAETVAELTASPRVAIIIDDLGDRLREGRKVIALPGNLTVGIIPFTPFARTLAESANDSNKEILLHIPMESLDHRYLGKSGLHADMTEQQLYASLTTSLSSIANIKGVSNHMGSQLTQDLTKMQWLMNGLRAHGDLYFVDSRTINTSKASNAAKQAGLSYATRDVFLDNDKDSTAMARQWRIFMKRAERKGSAIMIGHPYPQTITFLQQHLPEIESNGYRLVSVSELIRWRQNRSKLAWQHQESSSH